MTHLRTNSVEDEERVGSGIRKQWDYKIVKGGGSGGQGRRRFTAESRRKTLGKPDQRTQRGNGCAFAAGGCVGPNENPGKDIAELKIACVTGKSPYAFVRATGPSGVYLNNGRGARRCERISTVTAESSDYGINLRTVQNLFFE
jgi:hypothetical protein